MKKTLVAVVCFALGLSLVGCGVSIQTGPQTAEEATSTSEARGKGVRSTWVTHFEAASPYRKGLMLKTFVDSVTYRYLEYGKNVLEQWHRGSESRGEEIPATEMREMIDQWTETEKPLLQSYHDVVDYARNRILELDLFNPSAVELIERVVNNYHEVFTFVFHPADDAARYDYRLGELRTATETLSDELARELASYR